MSDDTKALATRPAGNIHMTNLNGTEIERFANAAARSGMFKDLADMYKAMMKITYGQELGIGPVQALNGIDVIGGQLTLRAHLIASLIQRSGRFKYRVREWTNEICRIEFFDGDESLGIVGYSKADAAQADLLTKDVWKKYLRDMLYNKAMGRGGRVHCAAVFGGVVYATEELADSAPGVAAADPDTGEIVDGEFSEEAPAPDLPATKEQQSAILAIFTERKWKIPQRAAWLRDTCNVASVADLTEAQAAYALTQLNPPAKEAAPLPVDIIDEAAA